MPSFAEEHRHYPTLSETDLARQDRARYPLPSSCTEGELRFESLCHSQKASILHLPASIWAESPWRDNIPDKTNFFAWFSRLDMLRKRGRAEFYLMFYRERPVGLTQLTHRLHPYLLANIYTVDDLSLHVDLQLLLLNLSRKINQHKNGWQFYLEHYCHLPGAVAMTRHDILRSAVYGDHRQDKPYYCALFSLVDEANSA